MVKLPSPFVFIKILIVWLIFFGISIYTIFIPLFVDVYLYPPTSVLGFWLPNPYWILVSVVLAILIREVYNTTKSVIAEDE